MKGAILVVLCGVLVACGGRAAKPRERALFGYDASKPLAMQRGQHDEEDGVVHQYLTFAAGYGERLAAIYTHPRGGAPWPVVLFSPGSGGDEGDQLPEANVLARRGIASLTVGTPQERELVQCDGKKDLQTYRNYVVSRRRALDLIGTLPGADATRVAAVGFSFGSAVTGTLVGVDDRLKAAVIQSGRAHHASEIGSLFCSYLGGKRLERYVRTLSVVDPVRFVARAAPTALLFQNGTRDELAPRAEVNAYFAAASKPKERRLYDAGHELTGTAFEFRDAWLARKLGVTPTVRTLEVGQQPFSVAFAHGSLWVANYGDGSVERIDPGTEKATARIVVGGQPWGLAADADSMWVGNNAPGSPVVRIDAKDNHVTARVKAGTKPIGVAAGSGVAYAASFEDGSVARIDGDDTRVARVPGSHEGAVLYGGVLWVPSEEGTLARLEPDTLRVTKTIRVGDDPDFVVPCGGALWASNYRAGSLWKVDPKATRVVARYAVPTGGQGMACARGGLWLVNYDRATLTEYDLAGHALRSVRTGIHPRAVTYGAGSLWVGNSDDNTVTRVSFG